METVILSSSQYSRYWFELIVSDLEEGTFPCVADEGQAYSLLKINCNARLPSGNSLRRQYTEIVKQLKSLLGAKWAHIKY